MGEKDISLKILEYYSDVFADIVNGLMFEGRPVVTEDALVDLPGPHSEFMADDHTLHEQERDVSKLWTSRNMILSLVGLENQSDVDYDMPLRLISYDGASYKSQLLADKENEPKVRYPVITIVLYFGTRRWTGCTRLSERVNVSDNLRPFFNDYTARVYEIAFLEDEQIAHFTSDFRILAEYCVKSRKDPYYVPSPQVIRHVEELMNAFAALAGDRKSKLLLPLLAKKGDSMPLFNVFEFREELGKARGLEEALIGQVIKKYRRGMSVEDIARETESEPETVEKYITCIDACGPDCAASDVFNMLHPQEAARRKAAEAIIRQDAAESVVS